MGEIEFSQLIAECNASHAKNQERINHKHLKAVRRAIWAPVGLLAAMLGWMLLELYGFNAKITGQEIINDNQTLNLVIEGQAREKLEKDLRSLDEKLDTNTKWLIENMNSKYRGANPLLK